MAENGWSEICNLYPGQRRPLANDIVMTVDPAADKHPSQCSSPLVHTDLCICQCSVLGLN